MRRTLTGRLLVRYALTIVAVLGAMAIALDHTLASIFSTTCLARWSPRPGRCGWPSDPSPGPSRPRWCPWAPS